MNFVEIIVECLLNFFTTLFFKKRDKRNKRKELIQKEKQLKFEKKPELYVCKEKNRKKADIEIFLAPFKVERCGNDYDIVYSKKLKNKVNHDYKDIIVENIGKSDIDFLSIVSTDKMFLSLINYNDYITLLDKKILYYNYCYDRKIRVGNKVKIRIYFERDNLPYLFSSATLALIFGDQNHNIWDQSFFYEQEKLYAPCLISYKEYRQSISTDDVYDCLERPWLG